MLNPSKDSEAASALARAIVDTINDLLLVLDETLTVVAASRSFYAAFRLDSASIAGRSIYDLIDGQFRVPALARLLEALAADDRIIEEYDAQLTLPEIGQRTLVLSARKVFRGDPGPRNLLLVFQDNTDRRGVEREKAELLKRTEILLEEKDVLLRELQHRVFNSLQIIASILLMKAESASSEARQYLEETHQRLVAVAKVQRLIHTAGRGGQIEIGPYLTELCDSLGTSMIDETGPVTLVVTADGGAANSADAVNLGLIVTELVINALKHAFPKGHQNPRIGVRYQLSDSNWQLVVSDSGVGAPVDSQLKSGLGLTLVETLAGQLHAQLKITNTPNGMGVSVTHEVFHSEFSDTS